MINKKIITCLASFFLFAISFEVIDMLKKIFIFCLFMGTSLLSSFNGTRLNESDNPKSNEEFMENQDYRIMSSVFDYIKKKYPKIKLVALASFRDNNEKQFVKFGGQMRIATDANNIEAIGLFLDVAELCVEALKNCAEVKDRLSSDFGVHNLRFALHISDPDFSLHYHPKITYINVK